MPRAVIADELGPLANYALRAYDPGPPKPNQVSIAVKAAGVSFVDVLTAEGKYHVNPPTPFIPGSECAGLITAVGAEVKQFSVGQHVVATGFGGIFAEVANLNARSVWPMPREHVLPGSGRVSGQLHHRLACAGGSWALAVR